MKKLKVLVMIVVICVLVFTGCGEKKGYLNLTQTHQSASDFYYETIDEANFLVNMGEKKALGKTYEDEYKTLSVLFFSSNELMYNLISVVDFCIELSGMEEVEGYNQKVYEYFTEYDAIKNLCSKSVVHVIKQENKNNGFIANLYSVEEDTTLSEIINQGTAVSASNTISITRDRASDVYTLIDTQNNIESTFYFNKATGTMKITLSYILDIIGNKPVEAEMEFYNYTNNVSGGRIVIETILENENVKCIFEHFAKPFTKRAKMGFVKDETKYYDLTKVEELNIAISNAGDSYGYSITYSNVSDKATSAKTEVNQYGLG